MPGQGRHAREFAGAREVGPGLPALQGGAHSAMVKLCDCAAGGRHVIIRAALSLCTPPRPPPSFWSLV
eukprot:1530324-Pyramimonas_sp.AAC.1